MRFGFNPPPCRGLNFGRPSFATPSVDGGVMPLVLPLDVLSGDSHSSIRVGQCRCKLVLWPIISSLHLRSRSHMGRIAAARGALCMLLVRPRKQQAAEKPYGEHLYASSSSSSSSSDHHHHINGLPLIDSNTQKAGNQRCINLSKEIKIFLSKPHCIILNL